MLLRSAEKDSMPCCTKGFSPEVFVTFGSLGHIPEAGKLDSCEGSDRLRSLLFRAVLVLALLPLLHPIPALRKDFRRRSSASPKECPRVTPQRAASEAAEKPRRGGRTQGPARDAVGPARRSPARQGITGGVARGAACGGPPAAGDAQSQCRGSYDLSWMHLRC